MFPFLIRPPQPTPNKQRPTRFWSEKYPDSLKRLTQQEVKLQEVGQTFIFGSSVNTFTVLKILRNLWMAS